MRKTTSFIGRKTLIRTVSTRRARRNMQAVYINSTGAPENKPFSVSNPAPSTVLELGNFPLPEPTKAGEVLIRIKASTVIRDTLTWPEMYSYPNQVPGHDFSGTVVSTFDQNSAYKAGDEIYGMVSADRAGCWAEYRVATTLELAHKPKALGWAEAAAVPLSTLTAWQALFSQAGIPEPDLTSLETVMAGQPPRTKPKTSARLLITGATGGVGLSIVQLASLTPYHVYTATSSKSANESFLHELGADHVVSYDDLVSAAQNFDVIIDTVGGSALERCWSCAKEGAVLVTIDSASYDFVKSHQELGISRDGVKALFFIVESSSSDLSKITMAIDKGVLKIFVAGEYPLAKARQAYELCHTRGAGRGKLVLTM